MKVFKRNTPSTVSGEKGRRSLHTSDLNWRYFTYVNHQFKIFRKVLTMRKWK
ncbi:hypothetical protein [Lederbergia lenta]|uniref:hypothetical protein n=1 Tax=Lederbergia lenta TaxID=1467 RepID=UPI00203FE6B9|nr:hypothetical protein [Lederbergia lenta]MCM3113162.1 hypothetical protein [Lederbergia lenta]